jgi:hypothetical protein
VRKEEREDNVAVLDLKPEVAPGGPREDRVLRHYAMDEGIHRVLGEQRLHHSTATPARHAAVHGGCGSRQARTFSAIDTQL